jgi:hypothetical protein
MSSTQVGRRCSPPIGRGAERTDGSGLGRFSLPRWTDKSAADGHTSAAARALALTTRAFVTFLYDASGERVAVRDGQHTLTTLALRGLDGRLLRTYVESGTSGSGTTSWQQDWVWANGTLLATVSADPDAGTRY